jgi:hypothetical protein
VKRRGDYCACAAVLPLAVILIHGSLDEKGVWGLSGVVSLRSRSKFLHLIDTKVVIT